METILQPPFDTELERQILGCMLSDPQCIGDIADILKPQYFYWRKHQHLCRKILELWQEDVQKVDVTLMGQFLKEHDIHVSEVAEMVSAVASTVPVRGYVERLRDIAALRAAINVGYELTQQAHLRDSEEIMKVITIAETKLAKLRDLGTDTETMTSLKDALIEFHEQFELIYAGQKATGLSTGFDDIDVYTSGLQDGDLIILAARPSMGKTALAIQMALHIGGKLQKPVLFFSLEMSKMLLVRRMIANVARIDSQKLNNGVISAEELERYTMAISELSGMNLVIDDKGLMTVAEMRTKARRVQRERGLSCVIIDYLGMIQNDDKRLSRYEAVSENTRMLKAMAKEFNVPVVCLAQLNRDVEKRADKRPMLSDLRETGEIEQTADVVMFLYRDDYYNPESEFKGIVEVHIAKQRNGPTGRVELLFEKEFNIFKPLYKGKAVDP